MQSLRHSLEPKLHENGFLSISDCRRCFSSLQESLQVLWNYYCDHDHWDLLLSTVVEEGNELNIQFQRMRDIQSRSPDHIKSIQDICRSYPSFKECHILAIFREELDWVDVAHKIAPPTKTKTYHSKKTVLRMSENVGDAKLSETHKPSKGKEPKKTELTLSKKTSLKEQAHTPVLTNYCAIRSAMEGRLETCEANKRKMVIDSDEEIYNPQTFQKMMEIQTPPKDSCPSAEKTCLSSQKKAPTSDDEDDEALFRKMEQACKTSGQTAKNKTVQTKEASHPDKTKFNRDNTEGKNKNQTKNSKPQTKKGLLAWLNP